jgi:hypothetical protein
MSERIRECSRQIATAYEAGEIRGESEDARDLIVALSLQLHADAEELAEREEAARERTAREREGRLRRWWRSLRDAPEEAQNAVR